MLHRRSALPVLSLLVESAERIVGITRRHFACLAEPEIAPWTAFTLRGGIAEVAVGDVIPIRVGPCAIGAERHVGSRVRYRGNFYTDVASERDLQRSPAVAEQIVRSADTRVETVE